MVLHQIKDFFAAFPRFDIEPGEVLIRQDQRPTSIFFLETGMVEQTKTTLKGQELILNLYKPGSFFPLIDSVADIPNQYAFRAFNSCTGFQAPKEAVISWMQSDAQVSFEISLRLLKGLHGMLIKTEKLMQRDATAILCQTLLTFVARFPTTNTKDPSIAIPLTHQRLADSTGLSRETITRELSGLKSQGVLTTNHRQITIISLLELQKLAENVREITVL